MKKSRVWKWMTAVGASALLLGSFAFSIGAGDFKNPLEDESKTENHIPVAEAATVTYPTSGGLGQFANGYTFVFTDKDKVLDYHSHKTDTDVKFVTVDTSAPRGSQANPYVINSTADWNTFVKQITTDTSTTTYGSGEYFVLGQDLDFSGVSNFLVVPIFSGTFYGMGHTLSNITSNYWKDYNGATLNSATVWGSGLFCKALNATITDLIVKDFTYNNFPKASSALHEYRGSGVGGISGYSAGNDCFLNCHVSGTFSSSLAYNMHLPLGGIVGSSYGGSVSAVTTTKIYRCSAETTVNYINCGKDGSSTRVMLAGIFIGDQYHCKNTLYLYDCAGNITVNDTTNLFAYASIGPSIMGWGSITYMDGVVGTSTFTSTTAVYRAGIIGGIWPNSVGATVNVKNVYTGGTIKNGSTTTSFGYVNKNTATSQTGKVTVSATNLHVAIPYTLGSYSDMKEQVTTAITYNAAAGGFDTLLAKTKEGVGSALNSSIWNASRIGGTYEPDNSPVRNYFTVLPEDTTFEYTGEELDISNASWFMDSIHGNKDMMTISAPRMLNANESGYSVTFNLTGDYKWSDGTTGPKQIKVIVNRKKLSLSLDTSGGVAVAKISGGLVAKDISNPPEIINTYYTPSGSQLPGTPQTVGDYIVKATIAPGGNYKLKNAESDPDPEFSFYLAAIPITVPTVSGDVTKQYTGKDITFLLVNDEGINEGKIIEPKQEDMPDGVIYNKNGNERTLTVKSVGNYRIPFTLLDQTNNCWSDGSGVLTLSVTQRPLNLTVDRAGGQSWEFETNTQEEFTITHDAVDGDNIALLVTYEKPDGTLVTVGADKMVTEGKKTTVTLDPFDRGIYKIRVALAGKAVSNDNGNYTLVSAIEQNVNVKGKVITVTSGDIMWRYSDGQSVNALERNASIPYMGRTITVSIDTRELADKGVRVDSYTNEMAKDVGTYETTVYLTKLNESYEYEDQAFSITWSIEKAKFDLSDVHWNYDGPIGYTGNNITITLLNVPPALTAQYGGNRSKNVTGDGYNNAYVVFKCTDENYYLPRSGAKDTYIYNGEGEDFPWTLPWQIKKGTIELDWDLYGGTAKDKNGAEFYYPTLLNGEGKVDYVFSNEENGTTFGPEEIEIDFENVQSYYVKAVLKGTATGNFELSTSGVNPLRFTIGEDKTAVRVSVTKMGGTYNGKPMPVEFTSEASDGRKFATSDFMLTYYKGGVIVTDEDGNRSAPIDAGTYKVRFTLVGEDLTEEYYIAGTLEFTFTIEKFTIDWSKIGWDYDPKNPYPYVYKNGTEKVYTVTLQGLPSTMLISYLDNSFSVAGDHKAKVEVMIEKALLDNYDGVELESSTENDLYVTLRLPDNIRELKWKILPHELTVPKQVVTGLMFDGEEFDLIALSGLDEDWADYITLSIKKGIDTVTGTKVRNAGTYVIVCTISGDVSGSVVWEGGFTIDQSCSVIIASKTIKVVGWQGKPSQPLFEESVSPTFYVVNYVDPSGNPVSNFEDSAIYGVRIRATVGVPENMKGNIQIVFDPQIKNYDEFIMFNPSDPVTLLNYPELVNAKLAFNFEEQTFVIKNWKEYKDWIDVLDPLTMTDVGTKTIRIALKSDKNVMWNDSEHERDIYTLTIEIAKGQLAEDWEYVKGIPTLVFDEEDSVFDLSTIIEYEYFDENGNTVKTSKMKQGVDYTVVANIKEEYIKMFGFGRDLAESVEYEFTFGVVPDEPDPGPVKPDPDPQPDPDPDPGIVGPGTINTSNLPLWQLLVGGISAILFVVCAAKAFGEYGKLKAAKREAKELAAVSYSVAYGFAPLPLLAVGVAKEFLGVGESTWTVIAFVALGLFLASLVAMLFLSKKRKAAELIVRREQARINEEKEFARQEEMKMMFSAMQQGYQQQPALNYGDMQNMIAASVQALLPAVSQMAALPPAQDPSVYADPAPYAAPQFGASASSGEADALREQMAQQQARMEAQMAQQQAQMAQQQELINQLLQNQQASQAAYADYDPDEHDEALWQDDGSDTIPLEESYGKLTDEAKRCYYEIGSYIMGKQRVSQNDGKYAVLFKYRGKTMFKLCIKGDAPVLYYLTDNGDKGSVRLSDAPSLTSAKTIIDQNITKRDRELG